MTSFAWGGVDFVDFDWDIDPRYYAVQYNSLADRLDDMLPPAVAARQMAIDDVREHFEKEEAPDGTRWQEWAPSYAPRAQVENIGILRKTDDLYEEVTSDASWPIIGDDVWVDTSTWPDYWRIHQKGGSINTTKMSAKRYVMRRRNPEGAANYGKIPARPYLGLSGDAQARILVLYHGWMTDQIQLTINPFTGRAQRRVPAGTRQGGQFGPEIGLR